MPQVRKGAEVLKTKDEIIAGMQRTIRESREAIDRLRAGDYTGFRYCGGPTPAEYIIANRFQSAITGAESVLDSLIAPEDLA